MANMPLATLVWFDPGETTGMCVVSVTPQWLAGEGQVTWRGMRQAIKYCWLAQIGTETRVWLDGQAAEPNDYHILASDEQIERAEIIASLAEYGELYRETFMVDQCFELLNQWPDAAWGYESFIPRTLAANFSPMRINAKVAHCELVYGNGRVPYDQTSSFGKVTATDERMKSAGLYYPGLGHGTDAARHAATFLREARKDGWLRAEAWPHLFEA